MAKLIITIDGPAGSGKSTVAGLLAKKLGISFLDTGAMYRAVTLAAIQAGIDMEVEQQLLDVLNSTDFKFAIKNDKLVVAINGNDVTEQIRSHEVTANAWYIASSAKVRAKLVQMQRQIAGDEGKIVTEGRDQGTVAFPDANIKFFLIADVTERAKRRHKELLAKGEHADHTEVRTAIEKRDKSDRGRAVGPLKPADNAILIDTTNLDVDEVVKELLNYVRKNT